MNLLTLLNRNGIPYQLEGPKTTPGFVNVHCPFCSGKKNYHLGISLTGRGANCWRCGGKRASQSIAKLLGVSEPDAIDLIKKYTGSKSIRSTKEVKRAPRAKSHKSPSGTGPLKARHKRYLVKQRRFNPKKLQQQWGLLGTGPMSMLDGINYSHRILAPINWNGKQVSFQTRDITGRHKVKYMACPKSRELIDHKKVLYGDQSKWGETGICVEGITDVWRLGPHAFATFGIKFTKAQIRKIANAFLEVIIIFDQEPQAQKQAKLLEGELNFRGVKTVRIDLKKDPADLTERQAKNLLKRFY